MKKILTLTALLLAAVAVPGVACTNFLVGKGASTDGATMISYSADSYGMYGKLVYYPAGKHKRGEMRRIVDGDTNHFMGEIPEAAETYSVMGNINEYGLSIMETTFGGRDELVDKAGVIDYVSLMALGMQRAKTAREAIRVMTDLVAKYGYASGGESFSIADPNEVWIMEMIGKGGKEKGAVWVAVRIPDDCIAAHANQSRIHRFKQYKPQDVMYSPDVITFARAQGYYEGSDDDFSFSNAYSPADFSAIRYCETRAWSFFNRFVDGMEQYLDYADGRHIGQAEPFPLYFKPRHKLSLKDVMNAMRDHYEGTPFDITHDAGAGAYCAPYRPTPLEWEFEGKRYFNERPISTQQTSYTVVAQLRGNMPAAVGCVLWFGNDDANMVAYTPVYCCTTHVPEPYAPETADDHTFSWKSAFWVCNWVSNMTYPRYSQLFPAVEKVRNEVEDGLIARQPQVEAEALALLARDEAAGRLFLDTYTNTAATMMLARWKELGEYLIVKFNDMAVKPQNEDGTYRMTDDGLAVFPQRPGFDEQQRAIIVRETGEKYLKP
ncbi:MAG: C69 family dipeptidase [Bacteroidaceae bacterium]|nr:C69 family dipeptidase [Bacteroidaceae bacterium]